MNRMMAVNENRKVLNNLIQKAVDGGSILSTKTNVQRDNVSSSPSPILSTFDTTRFAFYLCLSLDAKRCTASKL